MNYKYYREAMEREQEKRNSNFQYQVRSACVGILMMIVVIGFIVYLIVR